MGTETTARPPGWSKKWVLDRVRAGKPLRAVCEEAAAISGTQPATIRQQVVYWRRRDRQFEAELIEADPKPNNINLKPLSQIKLDKETIQEIVDAFVETKDLTLTAERVGITPSRLYAYLNRSKGGDPYLIEALEEARRTVGGEMVSIAFDAVPAIEDPFKRATAALKVGAAFDPKIGGRHDRLDIVHSGQVRHRLEASEIQQLQARVTGVLDEARERAGIVDAEYKELPEAGEA